MNYKEIKIGQTFDVFQNNFGCISGIHNMYDYCFPIDFRDVEGNVYYYGEKMKKIALLRIKKLK